MNFKISLNIIFGILLVLSAGIAKAQQGYCPPNMDFEYGNFSNWTCSTGTVSLVTGRNVITWTGASEVQGQHSIIPALNAGNDPYGRFPRICPNGSGYSVKLGNSQGGMGAEKISYTYTIPTTLQSFSLLFHYAVILQNPDHNVAEQPRFQAIITDLSSGARIPCANFDFSASSGLPGFQYSPVDWSVIYKDWTPVTVNLNEYIGHTIQIEFITSDCTRGQHFGYAYVDINSNCNGAILGTTVCQGDNFVNLTAPHGFQSYQWYSDTRFTTLLDTTQILTLDPAPSVGSVYPVIVFPYQGYGCIDTLYATISVSTKPDSYAGRDTAICKYQSVQLGSGPPVPGLMYSWTPANFVNNPIIPDPVAGLRASIIPTAFIVKTTDVLTGCFSYDTVVISPIAIDTAIRLIGNASFCDGSAEAALTLRNNNAGIQWYNNATTIPAATTLTYQPTISGSYWAQLTERGCTDTTAALTINVRPMPQAAFTVNNDTFCITNNSFVFTNSSSISDNSPIGYNWNFSDGSNLQTTHVTKAFNAAGTYRTQLITTTAFGCKDSTESLVYVMPNGNPDFSWDTICTNRPVLFSNLSNENGSPFVQYNWTFNNGGPGSQLKNPPLITYTSNGRFNVTLQIRTLGCESYPKQISKEIKVSSPLAGTRYKDITVPMGESRIIKIRDTVGSIYNWRPRIQLSNYNSPVTEFFATGNDVRYLIDITNKNTCVTTDTFLIQVLKKPGYYLPSAFTPNGDGLNDVITPYIIGMKSLKGFSIFNRWGNRIFYTTRYGESWDGKYGGVVQPVGVFVWILEYYTTENKLVTAKGTITIVR